MNDGRNCPACRKDIGLWPIFSALLPNRVTCPHCHARLGYRGVGLLTVILVLLMTTLGIVAYFAAFALPLTGSVQRVGAIIGMLLIVYIPIEIWAAQYLRRNKALYRVDS